MVLSVQFLRYRETMVENHNFSCLTCIWRPRAVPVRILQLHFLQKSKHNVVATRWWKVWEYVYSFRHNTRDRQTDTARQHRPLVCIASHGKKPLLNQLATKETKKNTEFLLTSLLDVLTLATVKSTELAASAEVRYRLLTSAVTGYRLIVSIDCGCITFSTRAGSCCCWHNQQFTTIFYQWCEVLHHY